MVATRSHSDSNGGTTLAAPDFGSADATTATSLTWLSPEAGLWVASRGNNYAGFIEHSPGGYVATDSKGVVQGNRVTLGAAKRLLAPAAPPSARTTEGVVLPLAICIGIALAGTSVSFLATSAFLSLF